MNSFKQLEDDQIKLFAEARHKRVYDRVSSSLGSLRFLSSIIEMYVPVMADTVVSLSGGETVPDTDSTNEEPGEATNETGKPPRGPAQLDDDDGDVPRIN